jgi:hypothetical protein
MLSSSLVLPAHGNAPYLIGINLLRDVTTDICIPEYYGDKQLKILKKEFPDKVENIFLSKKMGRLLKPLLRYKTDSFNTYALNVRENVERVSKTLEANYREGIDATSLSGTRKRFSKFDIALNTGLPIISPVEPVFFAFVGKMSAIYDYDLLRRQSDKTTFQHNVAFQRNVAFLSETWREIEKSFNGMFIPRLNSLYKLEEYYDRTGITFTPPFAQRYQPYNTSIRHGSILIVTSGARLDDEEKLRSLVASSPSPYVRLSESRPITGLSLPRVDSKSWGNSNIVAVLARGGFGTIWQALINQKPIGILKAIPEDDPEIFHNAKTVEDAHIGKILDTKMDSLTGNLPQYLFAIQTLLEKMKEEFPELEVEKFDGFKFTSHSLLEALK